MSASVLRTLQAPRPGQDSVTVRLSTRVPLFTGGIGQWGEQLHPSGILGGIRSFSCLVARTVGDSSFAAAVFGNAGDSGQLARAKTVSFRVDASDLRVIALPQRVMIRREDNQRERGWYYNQAQEGEWRLTLTRRGISDTHWNLLLLALRIQIRHATFGAKDQFGLGVVQADTLPAVTPLDESRTYPQSGFSLQRCAFGRLRLKRNAWNREGPTLEQALRLGLIARIALRGALRAPKDAPAEEQSKWTDIRHRLLGSLNKRGSAVNVSAAYPLENEGAAEIRLFVQLRLEHSGDRTEVMKRFNQALKMLPLEGWSAQPEPWAFGGDFGGLKHPAKWLNQLAGA